MYEWKEAEFCDLDEYRSLDCPVFCPMSRSMSVLNHTHEFGKKKKPFYFGQMILMVGLCYTAERKKKEYFTSKIPKCT